MWFRLGGGACTNVAASGRRGLRLFEEWWKNRRRPVSTAARPTEKDVRRKKPKKENDYQNEVGTEKRKTMKVATGVHRWPTIHDEV